MSTLVDRLTDMARAAHRRPESVGVLSTGERCAVALICDERSFLPRGYTFLDAVDRLGDEWLAAVLEVDRRNEWRQS